MTDTSIRHLRNMVNQSGWVGKQCLLHYSSCVHLKQAGVSIIEVLLMFSLLCCTMMTFTLLMGQTSQTSKGIYLQSSRSLLLQSLQDQSSPQNPIYVSLYNDSAFNTAITESGQVLPFMRKVDTTNAGATNSFQKTMYTYIYTNSTDSASSPRYQTALVDTTNSIDLRWGWTTSATDLSGRFMYGNNSTYSNATHQPGIAGSYGGYSTTSTFVNTNNQCNYKANVGTSSSMQFQFDVTNGSYTVKLFFGDENSSTASTSPNRRLSDIYIQGVEVNPTWPYGQYEYTRNSHFVGQVLTFDANVSNGVLTVNIVPDTLSNYSADLSGIIVKPRTTL